MSRRVGSLCTGYSGLDMAVCDLLDVDLAWVSDIDKGANKILAHRYPDTPNLGDFTTVDWRQVEPVEVLCAGFPCQPVSHAGKRAGTDDERWLFDDITSAVGLLDPQPGLLVFENVLGLLSANRGHAMARVVHGLAQIGYVGSWRTLRASDVGAPHRRERVFLVAWPADVDSPAAALGRADGMDGRAVRGRGLHLVEDGRQAAESATGSVDDRPRCGPEVCRCGEGGPDTGAVCPAWAWDEADMEMAGVGVLGGREPHQSDVGWVVLSPPCESHRGDDCGHAELASTDVLLPTPDAYSASRGGTQHPDKRRSGGHQPTIADVVEHLLPTPIASDAGHAGPNQRDSSGRLGLTGTVLDLLPTPRAARGGSATETVELLPTPRATDPANSASRAGKGFSPQLGEVARLLPTPTAQDSAASGGSTPSDVTLTDAVIRTDLGRADNPRHLLPTPTTEPTTGNGHARNLGAETRLLPTPTVSDHPDARRSTRDGATYSADGYTRELLGDVVAQDRWGDYAPAIARWETVIGRPAPAPTETGPKGSPRLSPRFVEWMMGLPEGWVTDVPGLTRNEQLKALGNGVVPQQAAAAVGWLLDQITRQDDVA